MNRLRKLRSMAHSQNFWWLAVMGLILMMTCLPMSAQFQGGVVAVDPTQGAQSVAKFIVDGVLYCVAAVAFVCFCWGIVQLFRRPLEGILEVAVGLTVMYLIGHSLGWTSALTGVVTG
jgi:hypothetical protein